MITRVVWILAVAAGLASPRIGLAQENRATIPIILSENAAVVERAAADDLSRSLEKIYPREKFPVSTRLPNSGRCIVLGSAASSLHPLLAFPLSPSDGERAGVRGFLQRATLTGPEGFVVAATNDGRRELGIIAGADARGTAYGVYALLEKLGCGFYLSYNALPPPRANPFSFAEWNLSDRPLARTRLVFNWHNFLSGCSTWNLPEWKQWVTQSHKMGYNAVMVHAYGNNPMASFEFNGRKKPVGYLSTTIKGRDWSTQHVNDVRRLWGGFVFEGLVHFVYEGLAHEGLVYEGLVYEGLVYEGLVYEGLVYEGLVHEGLVHEGLVHEGLVHDNAVFGADAALAPDGQRTEAARDLMREAFACAASNAMDVYFAYDVDTPSANPRDLALTLPPEARFPVQAGQQTWLANPETPEGYHYYKTQVQALLRAYPQISCLVVWFRAGGTPWTELKISEMPAAWQDEYAAEIAKMPEVAKLWHAPQMFALGKIVRAFARALQELGASKVQLASGTWGFNFLAPCDRFFPTNVTLIGLDYSVLHDQPQLRDAASRQILREVGAHRPIIPVIWAQHDDGNYLGRPYTPFADFNSKLKDANASGFGIIHWTTRPLDLFFTSHAKQVWQSTENQPLRATCEDMAAKSFGTAARKTMGEYLERWVTEAPKFARETSDYFIDRTLTNVEQVISGCRQRLKLLETVDGAKLGLAERDRLNYFKGLEQFIVSFYQTQEAFQRCQALLKSGGVAGARIAMGQCQPEKVIEHFARFSSLGGITRGEQGLVVSMNLRWLPHFVRLRQALGLEAVRYKFAPVSRDPLAQSAGTFTYHFDRERNIWQCLDLAQPGASTFVLPPDVKVVPGKDVPASFEEICRSGIESSAPIRFSMLPILASLGRGQGQALRLTPGPYRLQLLMLDPVSTAPGQRVFSISVKEPSSQNYLAQDQVDIFKETGQTSQILQRTYPVKVGPSGEVEVTLTPVRGKAILCGITLDMDRQN